MHQPAVGGIALQEPSRDDRHRVEFIARHRPCSVALVVRGHELRDCARVAHIRESRAGGSILESAATTILYPNSRNTPEELAPLALSDRELDFACVSALEARLALVRSGGASAIVDITVK